MAKKILLVEDDIMLRKLISKKFASEGYTMITAADGKKGLESVKENRPDLVILDLLLPVMDGFEVLKRLKEDESLKTIPVVIMSNLSQKEDIDRCMKLGATDYIVKVLFTSQEVLDKIKAIVK
jgi:DNA-binding response OmpR family regulator